MNDYKELIEALRIDEMFDAAKAIEQLVKERDAAIADLRHQSACWNCTKNGKKCHVNMPMERPNVMCGKFEWRGVQEDK